MPTSKAKPAPTPAANAPKSDKGPDFGKGVPVASIKDGVTQGHVRGEPALLYRAKETFSFVSATCTHFGAPLGQGLVTGDTVRCPWHHACFSLKTGEVKKAPGRQPLTRWAAVRDGKTVRADKKLPRATLPAPKAGHPASIGIVGGGAAAYGATIELQERGYKGDIHIYTAEPDLPYERIKLSKGALAGKVDTSKIALPKDAYVAPARVHVHLQHEVVALDAQKKSLTVAGKSPIAHGALLLATGGEPKPMANLKVDGKRIHTLRGKQDADAICRSLTPGAHVVIVGSSFIGMEAASALSTRDLSIHVVSHEELPFLKIFGRDVAQVLRTAHAQAGVVFHRQRSIDHINAHEVMLDDGTSLAADIILVAIGVTPRMELAKKAGLKVDNGIVVDDHMRTSLSGIFAAGDAAMVASGKDAPWRIEHWAVAEEMGRVAARNMLGVDEPYRAIPFFWTEQYDYKLRYVGHAEQVTRAETFGDIEDKHAVIALYEKDKIGAVVTVGRDDVSMACEVAMEHDDHEQLEQLLRS